MSRKADTGRLLAEALRDVPKFSGSATIRFRVAPRRYVVTMPDGAVLEIAGGSDAALRKARKAVDEWCGAWTRERGGQSIMVVKITVFHHDDTAGG